MNTSKSQAVQDLNWATGINRLSLQIYGIGIDNDGETSWRNTFAKLQMPLLFLSIFFMLIIPQTTALLRVWSYLFLLSDNLKLSLLFYVVELELIAMWNKNDVIATMMKYIQNDWMRPKTEPERDVMLRYGKLSRIVTIGGYTMVGVTIAADHIPILFGAVLRTMNNITDFGDRPFVMQSIYYFDAYKSPVYELIVITQFVTGGMGGMFYTTVGTLFGAIVLHLSAQFENLYNRIENMAMDDDADSVQINLKFTIKEHERLIRFSEMIESTFSIMILMVATGFSVIVCLQGYLIVVMFGDDIERPVMQVVFGIIYVTWALFISFVYSVVGDTLVTQSERIQYATYNCEWYKLKPQEAAQFIPILVRSQRPLVITAGKFAPINLSTFATLLKTIAGYISCLLAVRD